MTGQSKPARASELQPPFVPSLLQSSLPSILKASIFVVQRFIAGVETFSDGGKGVALGACRNLVGFAVGVSDVGYTVGFSVVPLVGPLVGLSVVTFEGAVVGLDTGTAVGFSLGLDVESSDGTIVGLSLGLGVGLSDGVSVGLSLGLGVGSSEGTSVGLSLGLSVGWIVGFTDGCKNVGVGDVVSGKVHMPHV